MTENTTTETEPEMIECPECSGSGYLDCPECGTSQMGDECPDCEGTGEIEKT